MASLIVLGSVFITAFLSAIFGMMGGTILIGVLVSIYPVANAMVLHGLIQSVSNGSRALFLKRYILWPVIIWLGLGAVIAFGVLSVIAFQLDRASLFIVLGFVAFSVWVPRQLFMLDMRVGYQAIGCGVIVTGLNVLVGVSGPVLDIAMQKLDVDRRSIVATKAMAQILSHLAKIGFYLSAALSFTQGPALWLLVLAVPASVIGTWLGGQVLHKMSDQAFRNYTKWIVTGLGCVFVIRGGLLLSG